MKRAIFYRSLLLCVAVGAGGLLLSGSHTPARAANTLSVGGGVDSGDCTKSACASISYALGKASAGDIINVGAGTYHEGVQVTKAVSLIGSGATLDASGYKNGVMVSGAGASGSVVSGFTIQNAQEEGVLLQQTSNVSILNNTVQKNDNKFNPKNTPMPCGATSDCGEGIHLNAVSNSKIDGNMVQDNVGGILLTDEMGPTSWNTISNNTSQNNHDACGITLASHFFKIPGPVSEKDGGVYSNTISGNTVLNNTGEAAGIGTYAGPPGAATYENRIIGNTIKGNSLPGVTMHSHAPFQNLNDNVIINNTISGNGGDDDAGVADTVGVMVFADVSSGARPIENVTIQGNSIASQKVGVYFSGTTKVFDVATNQFAASVGSKSTAVKTGAGAAGPSAAGGPPASSGSGSAPAVAAPAPSSGAPALTITPPNTGDAGLAAQ